MDMTNLIRELTTITQSAGIYDASEYGQILVQGPDAAAYLHKMTSNEVLSLAPHEGIYNALLDRKGMILSLFSMIRLGPDRFRIITPPVLTKKTFDLLTKMKFIQKLTIEDESSKYGLFFLIGPEAQKLIKTPPAEAVMWKENTFKLPVWNLSVPRETMTPLLQKLHPSVVSLSRETIKMMRLSVGFPEYGIDIDESNLLLEIKTPRAYRRQKGCYPGQEVVERILTYGKGRTPKTLTPLLIQGKEEIHPQTQIFSHSGEIAGTITSSLYHPLEKKTYLLASLQHKFVEGASELIKDGDRIVMST